MIDCNVVVSTVGWHAHQLSLLIEVARRNVRAHVSEFILAEYRDTIQEVRPGMKFAPEVPLAWFTSRCRLVEPSPLGKRRSMDPDDDPYLACALTVQRLPRLPSMDPRTFIVTRDHHILKMGKPFGLTIINPTEFFALLAR